MCRIRHTCKSFTLAGFVLGAIGISSAPVRADDSAAENEWALAAGAKLWENTWESWIVVPTPFNRGSREVIETINSNTRLAVIPQLSIRYGDWLATVSALTPTNYSLTPSWGTQLAASRYEIDGNFGYYVLPGLALTAGYKEVEQKFGGSFKWHGPTLGASGTASLGRGFSLYGTVGVGYMKAELPFADGADQTSLNANYALGEAGVAYSFAGLGRLTRSLNVTLGYRAQTLTTRGYGLADTSTTQPIVSRQDVRDTTQGPTLSVVAVF
jgi:hypothetical protein